MTITAEQAAANVVERLGLTDPETIALVSRVTTDYTMLAARKLAGEDVAKELAITEASLRNLDRAARNTIGQQVSSWVSSNLQSIMIGLLVPGP